MVEAGVGDAFDVALAGVGASVEAAGGGQLFTHETSCPLIVA